MIIEKVGEARGDGQRNIKKKRKTRWRLCVLKKPPFSVFNVVGGASANDSLMMFSLLCNSQSQWLPSSDSSSRLRRPAAPPPWLVVNTWSVSCRDNSGVSLGGRGALQTPAVTTLI